MNDLMKAWSSFAGSGKITDYIQYCNAKNQSADPDAQTPDQETVNPYAANHRRSGPPSAQN